MKLTVLGAGCWGLTLAWLLTDNFEEMWEQYMQSYEACHPEIFFEEMQREVDRRVAIADEVSPYEE